MKYLIIFTILILTGCTTSSGDRGIMVDELHCNPGTEVMFCDGRGGHYDCWCSTK